MRRGFAIRGWSLGLAAFALALAGATAPSHAEFPEKPVTVIIPFSAGGSHDVNARVFTSVIPEYLGQPVIVKLTPGAGGQKGTAEAIEDFKGVMRGLMSTNKRGEKVKDVDPTNDDDLHVDEELERRFRELEERARRK